MRKPEIVNALVGRHPCMKIMVCLAVLLMAAAPALASDFNKGMQTMPAWAGLSFAEAKQDEHTRRLPALAPSRLAVPDSDSDSTKQSDQPLIRTKRSADLLQAPSIRTPDTRMERKIPDGQQPVQQSPSLPKQPSEDLRKDRPDDKHVLRVKPDYEPAGPAEQPRFRTERAGDLQQPPSIRTPDTRMERKVPAEQQPVRRLRDRPFQPAQMPEKPADQPVWHTQPRTDTPSEHHGVLPGQGPSGPRHPAAMPQEWGMPGMSGSPFDRYGTGSPGGDRGLPQRDIPHKGMGPAGTAKQPPSGSPLDGRLGPGAVSSGGVVWRSGRHAGDGYYWQHTQYENGTMTAEFFHNENDTYPYRIVQLCSDGTRTESENPDIFPLQPLTGSSDTQDEGDPGDSGQSDDSGDSEDTDVSEESDNGEKKDTRPGDPDGYYGDEAPPDRFGIAPEPKSTTPADDGRFGGGREEEAPDRFGIIDRPDTIVPTHDGRVGGREKQAGPEVIFEFKDHLSDPPREKTNY